ncbi:MAG: hypothetical protein Q4A08_02170 [Bacteroidales bacterium]|nr:hypothetical protein [Bacteroidales bacterium]
MAITIQIPQHTDAMSPLGALIAHFNSSSKSVRLAFSKMIAESIHKEQQELLQQKISDGIKDIREGKGLSKNPDETTEQFFERLCTE